jgi:hypothetical protein
MSKNNQENTKTELDSAKKARDGLIASFAVLGFAIFCGLILSCIPVFGAFTFVVTLGLAVIGLAALIGVGSFGFEYLTAKDGPLSSGGPERERNVANNQSQSQSIIPAAPMVYEPTPQVNDGNIAANMSVNKKGI